MKPNALVLALVTAATALPGSASAEDDFCSRMVIYAINQICQFLPNGQTLCQPIGLAGPGPGASCDSPSQQKLVQIPLGPPAIQMSPYSPSAAAPNTFAVNPFGANPFGENTYPPFPFAPNLFGPNTYVPNAYGPPAASLPASMPSHLSPVPMAKPVAASPSQLAAVIEATPAATVVNPTEKLISETPQSASTAAVASSIPPTPAAVTAPQTVVSLTPIAAIQAAHEPQAIETAVTPAANAAVVIDTVIATTPAVAPIAITAIPATPDLPKPTITETAPVAPLAAPIATLEPSPAIVPTVTINHPPAVKTDTADAAAQAEKAERAIQDALAHFEFDSAELTPLGRAMLDTWLAQTSANAPLLVTGHADRLGPEPYNEKLSLLRAEAVKKYLIEKGKPANRIQIQAKGEAMPVVSCAGDANSETKSCLAPNRRAEIVAKPIEKTASKTKAKAKNTPKPKVIHTKTKSVR
jgi:outer membrane protein OmpA-like peptidoglycan-associated protein